MLPIPVIEVSMMNTVGPTINTKPNNTKDKITFASLKTLIPFSNQSKNYMQRQM